MIRETARPRYFSHGKWFLSSEETPKWVIQHEACYQNQPSSDKWPCQPVQKFFKKVKKKLVTPLKC
jgi:hypothetical protein